MTVVSAWVRKTLQGAEEIVVVSDSRLSGGGSLDCSPKIIQLPRSDAVMAYAGDTFFAYPIIHQISEAIRANRSLQERVKDYSSLRNFILKVMNEMYALYDNGGCKGFGNPQTGFVLAGYSWFKKEFMIDIITFKRGTKMFEHQPVGDRFGRGKFCFTGDMGKDAFYLFCKKLEQKHGAAHVKGPARDKSALDMEPFEVIRDMLRSADSRVASIGGAPQIVTVSQHMNSRQTAVYWPSKETGKVFLGGAPVVDLNYLDSWIMDPDTMKKSHLNYKTHDKN